MKKIFIASLIFFFFTACKKDDNANQNIFVEPIDTLPAYTETGANTMGCMFGGKVISAINYIDSNFKTVECTYLESIGLFWVDGVRTSESGITRMRIVINTLTDTGMYLLKEDSTLDLWNRGEIEIDSSNIHRIFTTSNIDTGYVHIRKLDKVNKIISGEFSFNSIEYFKPVKRKILNGRFDTKYE